MGEPKRIQRKRTKGWRMPANAVAVSRPGRWGNMFKAVPAPNWPRWGGPRPWHVEDIDGRIYHPETDLQVIVGRQAAEATSRRAAQQLAVDLFDIHTGPMGDYEYDTDTLDQLRRELAGHDLACWCSEADPCHSTVLLTLANTPRPVPA